MEIASRMLAPPDLDLVYRSDPARSTRLSLEEETAPPAGN